MDELLARFWESLTGRLHGPLTIRLILQPVMAAIFAVRAGLADARQGRHAYFWALFANAAERRELLKSGWKDVAKVFTFAVIMDLIYQIIVFRRIYPVEALCVAAILAFLPYLLLRGPVNRIARHFR